MFSLKFPTSVFEHCKQLSFLFVHLTPCELIDKVFGFQ